MEDLTFPAAGEARNVSHWLEESRMKVAYTFRDPENPRDVTSIGIDPAERVKYGLRDRAVAARATIRMSDSSQKSAGTAPGVEPRQRRGSSGFLSSWRDTLARR